MFLSNEVVYRLKWLIYFLDANNLYGSAQSLPMPHSKFKWVDKDKLEYMQRFFNHRHKKFLAREDMMTWEEFFEEKNKGYFLKVNLEYPKKLHKDHSDFPLGIILLVR